MLTKLCRRCEKTKPVACFDPASGQPGKFLYACKSCMSLIRKAAREKDPEKFRAKVRKSAQARRDRARASGLCVTCCQKKPISGKKRCRLCLDALTNRYRKNAVAIRETAKRGRQRLKLQVFEAYGGCRCSCCGETEIVFLTLEHTDGGGRRHRKQMGGGDKVYAHLRRTGFPAGYEVLCWNCNAGRHFNGGVCPHKRDQT